LWEAYFLAFTITSPSFLKIQTNASNSLREVRGIGVLDENYHLLPHFFSFRADFTNRPLRCGKEN